MNLGEPVIVDRHSGMLRTAKIGVGGLRERAKRQAILLDAKLRTLTSEPEEGAATAEYAVVLVAATGFAALLVGILKSNAIKTLLTDIVEKALSAG